MIKHVHIYAIYALLLVIYILVRIWINVLCWLMQIHFFPFSFTYIVAWHFYLQLRPAVYVSPLRSSAKSSGPQGELTLFSPRGVWIFIGWGGLWFLSIFLKTSPFFLGKTSTPHLKEDSFGKALIHQLVAFHFLDSKEWFRMFSIEGFSLRIRDNRAFLQASFCLQIVQMSRILPASTEAKSSFGLDFRWFSESPSFSWEDVALQL